MPGKKALLGEFWSASGLAPAGLKLLPCGPRRLIVLAYHRILDIASEDAHPGDPGLISASVSGFEQQMRFVRDNFVPLSLASVLEALDRGAALPPRSLVVTFDDGHIDNYTNAFPVLKRLGVPATIFLSTAYIDAPHTPFWFDRVAELFFHAPPGTMTVGELGHTAMLGSMGSRRHETNQLLRRLKREPNQRRLSALDELEQSLAQHVPARHPPRRAAMSWDEVREMANGGIEFGSHTVTHPILSRLDDVAMAKELSDSRDRIRARTGQPVDAIAYPVGKADAYDERTIRAAKACGYRIGLSYETGINRHLDTKLFELRRLAVERYVSLGNFKAMLSLPEVFA